MGIALEEERQPGLPVVKRTALGQKYFGAVVKVQQRDRLKKDDTTGNMVPILKANQKPRQEMVITCLTLPGTTAPVGLGDDEHVPEAGELARLILKGKAFADWIEAKRELGRPVNVGDIVQQTTDKAQVYDAQGNPSGPEIADQAEVERVPRGRSVGIYGPVTLREPKPNSEWLTKAEEAYHNLNAIPAEDDSAATADSNVVDDEPPF
jgi:hypothetical protein